MTTTIMAQKLIYDSANQRTTIKFLLKGSVHILSNSKNIFNIQSLDVIKNTSDHTSRCFNHKSAS